MFYDLFDLHRRQWDSWLGMALQAGGQSPFLAAHAEIIRRSFGSQRPGSMSLEDAVRQDAAAPVEIVELPRPSAFCRLMRFKRGRGGAEVLFIAPYSGYATAVTSPLIAALGDVIVTDWADAKDVPLDEGRFGLDEQIELVARLIAGMDGTPLLAGLSQSGPVVLAGALLAHARGSALPPGIILLGSPVDTRQAAGPLQHWLDLLPEGSLESQLAAVTPERYRGAGRKVYPGFYQLMTYAATNPGSYLETQAGLWSELLSGVSGPYERMHSDLHHLLDLPAELYGDMIERILRNAEFASGSMRVAGVTIDPSRLGSVPILSIEARQDELVGCGQTHAVHKLVAGGALPDGGLAPGSVAVDVDGGHETLFCGPDLNRKVSPHIAAFIAGRGSG